MGIMEEIFEHMTSQQTSFNLNIMNMMKFLFVRQDIKSYKLVKKKLRKN